MKCSFCCVLVIALSVHVNVITAKVKYKLESISDYIGQPTETGTPEIPESTHNETSSQSCYETCAPYPEFECINETCIQCYVDDIYLCLNDIEVFPISDYEYILELSLFFGVIVLASIMIHVLRCIFSCQNKCCTRSKAVNGLDDEIPPAAVASVICHKSFPPAYAEVQAQPAEPPTYIQAIAWKEQEKAL